MYYQHQNHEKILTFWKGAGDVSTYSTDTGTVMYSWTLMIEQLDSPPFRFFLGLSNAHTISKVQILLKKSGFWAWQTIKNYFLGWLTFYRLRWVEFYRYQKFKQAFCQNTFLDKNWTFNIVWGEEGYFEYAKDSSSVFFFPATENRKRKMKSRRPETFFRWCAWWWFIEWIMLPRSSSHLPKSRIAT